MTIYNWNFYEDDDEEIYWACQDTQEIIYFTNSALKHNDEIVALEIWEQRIDEEKIIKPSEDKYPGSILAPSNYLGRSELGYNNLGKSAPYERFPNYDIFEIFHSWDIMTEEFEGWLVFYMRGGYRNDGHYPYN